MPLSGIAGNPGRLAVLAAALLVVIGVSVSGCARNAPSDSPAAESIGERLDRGSYEEAETGARALLEAAEASAGPNSPEAAAALDLLVEALWRAGKDRDPETLELAVRAVETNEQVFGNSDPRLAASLTNLGTVQRRNRDPETMNTLDRALRLVTETAGSEDARAAPVLTQIGIVRLTEGDAEAARTSFERAIAILEKHRGPDDPSLTDPLRALGVLERRMGNLDAARATYERLLDLEARHLAEDSPDRARSLTSYGALLQNLGDFAGAREHFEQALEIRRRTLDPDHPDIGAGLNNLAIVLDDTGDDATASRYYGEALAIFEKQLGPDHPYVADALNNQGNALREMRDHEGARAALERALALREETLAPDHPDLAQSLTNLAILFTDMGEYASAEPLYEKALKIWRASLGPEHLEVAECLGALADLRTRMGDPEHAAPMFREALAIRENAGGPDHPLVAETLTDASRASLTTGNSAAALDMALRAHGIRREHVRLTSQTLTEREALTYGESRIPALEVALSVALSDAPPRDTPRRVWDAVMRSRAVVLDEMAFRSRDLGTADDPEIADRIEELDAARADLADLWVGGGYDLEPEEYREMLDRAHQDKEKAETALARASLDFRQRRKRERSGFDEVRAALPDGTALVAYLRFQREGERSGRYLAFVLGAARDEPVLLSLGVATAIEGAIGEWRRLVLRGGEVSARALREAETEYREAGTRLRSLVWDPVLPHLGKPHRVFLVADGSLHLVSFASLPVDPDRYLIERGPEIQAMVTERDLLSSDRGPDPASGLLALGGPAYDDRIDSTPRSRGARRSRSACGAFRTLEFPPLPEAEREVREIAVKWDERTGERGAARVLTGDEATETAFKKLAPRSRVVHLATHGFFLGGECASLEGDDAVASENPLLLSGLAFAGANRRHDTDPDKEDGILTAEEIAAMDLHGTEWVVLSACDTALGPIRTGEDVFGLRRAFQIAGARRVVMSLWQVDDLAGREWMSAFYDAAFAMEALGSDAPDRRASLAVLEERRRSERSTHPYYWAGFVTSGR